MLRKPDRLWLNGQSVSLEASFAERIMQVLIEEFDIAEGRAQEMVEHSAVAETLREDPEFVMHYSAKHWAKEIVEEYRI